MQTSISLPFITATADGPKHIETNLSRAKFEELASDLLDRCRIPVEQALKDANLSVSDINEVILVGGSTRIPAVQVVLPPGVVTPTLECVATSAMDVLIAGAEGLPVNKKIDFWRRRLGLQLLKC